MGAKFCFMSRGGLGLVFYRFVIAGGAAGLAVHQAVGAEADVELRLAGDTELLAPAAGLDLLALGAHQPAGGAGGQASSLMRRGGGGEGTGVHGGAGSRLRGQGL